MSKVKFAPAVLAAAVLVTGIPVTAADSEGSASVLAQVASKYEVTIPKTLQMVVDEDWHGTAKYLAGVTGDIEVGTSVYVVPQAVFRMVNTDDASIPEVVTTVTQDKTEWTWQDLTLAETPMGNGFLSGDDFNPGHSEGIFYFNISHDDSGKGTGSSVETVEIVTIDDDRSSYQIPMSLAAHNTGQVAVLNSATNNITSRVDWVSDSSAVVVSNGYITTANAEGGDTATITGTYGDVTIEVPVDIYDVLVPDEITVRAGDVANVEATVVSNTPNAVVRWNTGNLQGASSGNTLALDTEGCKGDYTVTATYESIVKRVVVHVLAGNPPTLIGATDGTTYQNTVTFSVGEEDTVTLDGNPLVMDSNNSHTITQNTDGSSTYTIVVTGTDGTTITATIIVEHIHEFGDWADSVAATCTTPGTQVQTCSICGAVNTQDVAALGHNWVSSEVDTTMTFSYTESKNCWWESMEDVSWVRNRLNKGKMYVGLEATLNMKQSSATGTSQAVYTVTLNNPTVIQLTDVTYKLSYADRLEILVDGVVKTTLTGDKSGIQYSFSGTDAINKTSVNVPAGTHTITYRVTSNDSKTDTQLHYSGIGNRTITDTANSCSRCGAVQ